MNTERLDVNFPSEKSGPDSCICDCCHAISGVLKIKIPHSKYANLWICDDCRLKLITALMEGDK